MFDDDGIDSAALQELRQQETRWSRSDDGNAGFGNGGHGGQSVVAPAPPIRYESAAHLHFSNVRHPPPWRRARCKALPASVIGPARLPVAAWDANRHARSSRSGGSDRPGDV